MNQAIQIKERPILFNGEMVRAILDGRKTQTRRIVKPSHECKTGQWPGKTHMWSWNIHKDPNGFSEECNTGPATVAKCPYGKPGDRLWVRETHEAFEKQHPEGILYRADFTFDPKGDREHGVRWTPSIHMPRWASRIDLLIKDVRVERLKDIKMEDAIAEGVRGTLHAISEFKALWGSINGAESWNLNPWVWVVTFERIQ